MKFGIMIIGSKGAPFVKQLVLLYQKYNGEELFYVIIITLFAQ